MFSLKNKLLNSKDYAQLFNQLGNLITDCRDIQIDSRKVGLNDIFCAYPGKVQDGRDFILNVAKYNNPCAIIYEEPYDIHINCTNFAICNLQQYVGLLAASKYDYPSRSMLTFAVTGTNGKTSISYWLNQAFTNLGNKTAIIGTTGCGLYTDIKDLNSTTPDPITLQKLFAEFYLQHVDVVAIEVSSHALDQGRVNGTYFDTAIFTNLTQDHLDYHGNLENYFLAKAQLFYWQDLKNVIVNLDDSYGKRLYNELKQDGTESTLLSYGINTISDVMATNVQLTLSGMSFDLTYRNQLINIKTSIIGLFNLYNLLAVFAALIAKQIPLEQIAVIAKNLRPVVGRMEALVVPNKPLVIIDYAHTPDALQNALQTLKQIQHRKLYCVFGCGGNRDTTKRSIMGNIVANLADMSYITSDNPRNENPLDIINQISQGFVGYSDKFTIIEERKQAIIKALSQASEGDIVLIAGKGHETYQEISGVKYHFSDREIADNYYKLSLE